MQIWILVVLLKPYCAAFDYVIMWHVKKVQLVIKRPQQPCWFQHATPSAALHTHILSLLDSGHSGHQISSSTGLHLSTISRLHRKHHPYLQKPTGGCPSKLSEADTCYAQHLITSRKAENAPQITQILQDITSQSLTSQTTWKWRVQRLWWRPRSLSLPRGIGGRGWIFPWLIWTGLWRTGRLLYGLMRPKLGWGPYSSLLVLHSPV